MFAGHTEGQVDYFIAVLTSTGPLAAPFNPMVPSMASINRAPTTSAIPLPDQGSMDKHRKLRKYRQKDYTQLVEFPVEIVGRNGVVRTYCFEDSICLYQRRIASAPRRYDDAEVVEAEIRHCSRRVRQLRRSYYERYAWGSIRSLSQAEVDLGVMAADIVAFLARYAGSVDRAERYALHPVETTGQSRVWFVEPPGEAPLLLYLFRLSADDDCPSRSEFEALTGSLRASKGLEDLEQLHASHTTADCVLLLTGREPRSERAREVHAPATQPSGELGGPDLTRQAVAMIRAGTPEDALRMLEAVLVLQPDHRNAALTASLAAIHAGSPAQAEMYVRLASAYSPDDAILLHQLGVTLLHQDRLAEAEDAFAAALASQHWLLPSRLLLALLHLRAGRHRKASELLDLDQASVGASQRSALRAVANLSRRFRWRRLGLMVAASAICLELVWVWLGLPLALPSLAVTALCATLLWFLVRRPDPLSVALDLARRVQLPREMLPPSPVQGDEL